jgi:hypothetical protein
MIGTSLCFLSTGDQLQIIKEEQAKDLQKLLEKRQ